MALINNISNLVNKPYIYIYIKDFLAVDKNSNKKNSDCFVVPSFQRNFTWDKKRVISFLDSIIKDYPIPSILIWNYDEDEVKGSNLFRLFDGGIEGQKLLSGKTFIGEQIKQGSEEYFNTQGQYNIVIDGQQRLSTLLWAFNKKNFVIVIYDSVKDAYYFEIKTKTHKLKYNEMWLSDFYSKNYDIPTEFTRCKEKFDSGILIGFKENNASNFDRLTDIFYKINTKPKLLSTGDVFVNSLGSVINEDAEKRRTVQNFFKKCSEEFHPNIIAGLSFLISNQDPSIKLSKFNEEHLKPIIEHFIEEGNQKLFYGMLTSFHNDSDFRIFVLEKFRTSLMCFFILKNKFSYTDKKYLYLLLLLSIGVANTQGILSEFYYYVQGQNNIPTVLDIIQHFDNSIKDKQDFVSFIVKTQDVNLQKIILYAIMDCTFEKPIVIVGGEHSTINNHLDHLHPSKKFPEGKNRECDLVKNKQLLYGNWNQGKSDTPLDEWMKHIPPQPKNVIILDPTDNDKSLTYKLEDCVSFWNEREKLIKTQLIKLFED